MKSAEQWRHEAHVAVHSNEAFTVDNFIAAVQRDAFDAGALSMRLAISEKLTGRRDPRYIKSIDWQHIEGRP